MPSVVNLQITRAGYLRGGHAVFVNSAGQTTAPVRINLTPEAIIAGKLEDEDGFPVDRASVQVMRYQTVNGERQLLAVGRASSDDRGEYRAGNLPPGRYYVRVSAGDATNWDARYVPQYFGGTLQPDDGHMVEVKTGQELKNTDIRLTKYEGVTVSGRLEGVSEAAAARPERIVLLPDPGDIGSMARFAVRSAGNGAFTLRHVPPGNYTLRYQPTGNQPKAGEPATELAIQVDTHDLRDLVLAPHATQPVDVQGQVVVREGGLPGPVRVNARAKLNGGIVTARSNEDGTFTLQGLMPGHYLVQVQPDFSGVQNAPFRAAYAVSAKLGDQEVLQSGFDAGSAAPGPLRITMSTKYLNVTGRLVDPEGNPVAGAMLFFQSGQQSRRTGAMTDEKGIFRATMTAAGDYHVYMGADQFEIVAYGEDEYLKAHEKDFPVLRVIDGENPPVTLVWNSRPAQ
jgi:hypothetical protein